MLQTGQGAELLPVHPVRSPTVPAVLAGGGLLHPHAVLQVPGVVPGRQPRFEVQQGVNVLLNLALYTIDFKCL